MSTYVTLTFRLEENVSETFFAQRVAEACFKDETLLDNEAVVLRDKTGREFKRALPRMPLTTLAVPKC
jgi:hypothetical protein